MIKTISILGVTGSIGSQALDVIKNNPEHFKLGAVSAGRNIKQLQEVLRDFNRRSFRCRMKMMLQRCKKTILILNLHMGTGLNRCSL